MIRENVILHRIYPLNPEGTECDKVRHFPLSKISSVDELWIVFCNPQIQRHWYTCTCDTQILCKASQPESRLTDDKKRSVNPAEPLVQGIY